jgi:dephospho-CoA kinase
VRNRQAELAEGARKAGASIIVHDIPLLFESADPDRFDRVVLVDAPEPIRRERLVRHRGLDPDLAGRLIAAQLPATSKRARSHYVIENDGTLEQLQKRSREVWDALLAEARARA